MKYKKIMLIALLLLAVLTIGAVSASDDAALDNVTASDDVDVIVGDSSDTGGDLGSDTDGDSGSDAGDDAGDDTEEYEYGAWFNESEIDVGYDWDENVVVASMTVPNTTTAGSFVISNDYVELFSAPIVGGDAWKTDEKTKGLVCDVLLKDLRNEFYNVNDGDVIYFDFFDGEGNAIEDYCAQALYKLNYSSLTIQLVDIEIYVYADDVNNFNLSDDGDLNQPFAFILAPAEIKGNFTIYAGEDDNIRYYFNKNLTEMVGLPDEETGLMNYSVSLNDLTNLDDFAEEDDFTIALLSLDENYDWECADYEIDNDEGIISFTEIDEDDDDEVDFDIDDIDTTEPDEAFVTVSVAERKGYFKILLESGPEPMTLFSENLNTTTRPYEMDEDDWYCFNFTYTDVNNYIKENIDGADNFTDVVEDGYMVVFAVEYDDAEPYTEAMIVGINPDGMIVFDPVDDEDDDVQVDCEQTDVVMRDGWRDYDFMDFMIRDTISGSIVINLDDTEVFNEALSDLPGIADGENPSFIHYYITFNNLTADLGEGTYLISWWVYEDGEEDPIDQYDDEDPDFLTLHEAQIAGNENTTIEIIPSDVIIGHDDAIIIINTTKTEGNVVVYVDDNETSITIPLSGCTQEDDVYLIGAEQLSLKEGIHTLKVSFDGLNLTGDVCLFSNVRISLPEDDEIIYTGFGLNEYFIHINREEGEDEDVEGTVNATIYDGETIIATVQKDIKELYYHPGPHAYVISVDDFELDYDLSGNYFVLVKYFNGNEADTMNGDTVAFKKLAADDFEFTATEGGIIISKCPVGFGVLNVTIDGVSTIYDLDDDVDWDDDGETGFLPIDELDNGTHKVGIVYKTDVDSTESLDVADVVTNPVDPALTISVANITEGNPAVVTITTNATFSGIVLVKIGNKEYNVTVTNGKGTLNVANLAANDYNATAIFAATGIFAYSEKTTKFTVSKKPVTPVNPVTPAKKANKIKLTLKKVKVKKSAKKLVLRATLKINGKAAKGKKIIFKFKGKKYRAKTNKKGVAKVTIKKKVLKKLKVGKKVKYQATYGKVTKKYTVKVKR